jgi:hypothetical protein
MLAYTVGSVAIILSKGGWFGSGSCSHLTTLPDNFFYATSFRCSYFMFCFGLGTATTREREAGHIGQYLFE